MYTMGYYPTVKKEGNLAICDNVDGPKGHYTKWNESDRDDKHHDLIYMWNLKMNEWINQPRTEFIEETGWWLPRGIG